MAEHNNNLAEVQRRGYQAKERHNQVIHEITGIEAELRQLKDVRNHRLMKLRQKSKHAHDAVLWLQENRDRFKKPIHEPIMLVVNMYDSRMAKYVENHINFKDMVAFVCEDADDMELFMKTLRDEQDLRINAVKVPDEPLASFVPPKPIEHYSRYGFHSFLRELFDAPEGVVRYLCAQHRVHQIPVGDETTKRDVEEVIRRCGLQTFYTANHKFSVRKSKYGNRDTVSSSTELREASIIAMTVDQAQINELQESLSRFSEEKAAAQTEQERVRKEEHQLVAQVESLRVKKKELQQKKYAKAPLVEKIKLKEDKIARLERDAIDLASEERRANDAIKQIKLNKVALLKKFQNVVGEVCEASKQRIRLYLLLAQGILAAQNLDNAIREASAEHTQLQDDYAGGVVSTATQLKAKRGSLTFRTYPDTLDELDALIHDEQARAACYIAVDESVVHDYVARKERILQLEEEVSTLQRSLDDHGDSIEHVKRAWIEPVLELIAGINKNFEKFFSTLHCAGQVDLNRGENEVSGMPVLAVSSLEIH
ncbi:PREDICTED: structural maintenance of chromosomes protein 5-like [Priapulus caudatus]|uniref:Structural maintenance of chromosomes protein 5-like n=1 Tax=Priapulus caudatus TaxID=37621 RepID=A0ABM1E3A3_PRICU|nr:PREDICTED: structural maintenance of chromosomes protein 5-like [Priapulus caudatus]